jgi:predicted dehydrogenase
MNELESDLNDFNRRDFLKGGSLATLMTMLGGVRLFAQATSEPSGESKLNVAPVKCAVIGLGAWGREILATLGGLPHADIAAVCDTYPAYLRRVKQSNAAPNALQTEDYKTILDNKDISAVIIATPTHKHKDIVLAALKAGKHVYCEAPLANSIDDARAIALAGKAAAPKQAFQSGLQMRSDPQRHFLLPFIRSGTLGTTVMARAQWHKKQSWRATSSNPDQEKALNWRLHKETSIGLLGEIGIHQLDQAAWLLNGRPTAITGFGSVVFHRDDRDVPDTVQAILEFSNGVRMIYDATLANSFDADYELYYGSDAAVMLRENKAWMFKEVDSPLLGWEVYARKDVFYKETGIALVANATKLLAQGDKPVEGAPVQDPPLKFALDAFLKRAAETDDFIKAFGDDPADLAEHMKTAQLPPAAGYLEGFRATVTAIKANEAVTTGQKLLFKPEWYELG